MLFRGQYSYSYIPMMDCECWTLCAFYKSSEHGVSYLHFKLKVFFLTCEVSDLPLDVLLEETNHLWVVIGTGLVVLWLFNC